jgi:hypothetical protein
MSSSSPQPPVIATGRELYNMLMANIDPELTDEGRKKAEVAYRDETPEERAIRMRRYERSIARCEEAYRDYIATLDTQIDRYKRDSFRFVETEDRARESGVVDSLAAFIQGFAA